METKTESKEQQWKKSISPSRSSSSRSSSITSESSDGNFDIRHFPLPKPVLSASEAQKQRETHQAYSSSVSSYTGSSWSSVHQNHMIDLPGYDPNRIPSSVFSSKPANSTEWSIASNESLFSIHDLNFNISTKEDHGLATTMRLSEIPRFEETIHEITEIEPVSVKKPTEHEKETITEKKPDHVEKSDSDSEIDDDDVEIEEEEEEEMTEIESNDEYEEEEEEEDMIDAEVLVEIETEKIVEDTKENKPEDTNSTTSHSPTISCRSDTSNNSIGSFAFPLLQKEDEVDKTPCMISKNVSQYRRPKYLLAQSPMQPQFYPPSGTSTQFQPQSQPQRKASIQFESQTQSQKASSNGWFSCFHLPTKCGLFK